MEPNDREDCIDDSRLASELAQPEDCDGASVATNDVRFGIVILRGTSPYMGDNRHSRRLRPALAPNNHSWCHRDVGDDDESDSDGREERLTLGAALSRVGAKARAELDALDKWAWENVTRQSECLSHWPWHGTRP